MSQASGRRGGGPALVGWGKPEHRAGGVGGDHPFTSGHPPWLSTQRMQAQYQAAATRLRAPSSHQGLSTIARAIERTDRPVVIQKKSQADARLERPQRPSLISSGGGAGG